MRKVKMYECTKKIIGATRSKAEMRLHPKPITAEECRLCHSHTWGTAVNRPNCVKIHRVEVEIV